MKESTRKWVEKAIKDLKIAENLCNQRYYEYACYFSQQSVEKLLKAFLIDNNRPYPRTHDIRELIKLCTKIDESFKYLFEIEADKLTIYATETRYPEYEFEVSEEEAKEAIEIAEKVRNFVLKKLEP